MELAREREENWKMRENLWKEKEQKWLRERGRFWRGKRKNCLAKQADLDRDSCSALRHFGSHIIRTPLLFLYW